MCTEVHGDVQRCTERCTEVSLQLIRLVNVIDLIGCGEDPYPMRLMHGGAWMDVHHHLSLVTIG